MMKTRSEISDNNKYYISKYRYLELKNFCMQYPIWIKTKSHLEARYFSSSVIRAVGDSEKSDKTADICETIETLGKLIGFVDESLSHIDQYIRMGIKECVTNGVGYDTIRARGIIIPCSRVKFYEEYRKFFFILSHIRN